MSEEGVAKLIKASKKEGGKLGIDLTGAAELGGTEFFVCYYIYLRMSSDSSARPSSTPRETSRL